MRASIPVRCLPRRRARVPARCDAAGGAPDSRVRSPASMRRATGSCGERWERRATAYECALRATRASASSSAGRSAGFQLVAAQARGDGDRASRRRHAARAAPRPAEGRRSSSRPQQISLGKLDNTRDGARRSRATARGLLGGNGDHARLPGHAPHGQPRVAAAPTRASNDSRVGSGALRRRPRCGNVPRRERGCPSRPGRG